MKATPIPCNLGIWRPCGEARKLLQVNERSSSRMLKSPPACLVHLVCSVCLVGLVYVVYLVCLVHRVGLVQPNKRDRRDRPDRQDRPNRPNRRDQPERPDRPGLSRSTELVAGRCADHRGSVVLKCFFRSLLSHTWAMVLHDAPETGRPKNRPVCEERRL